jgi:hypothetical protein
MFTLPDKGEGDNDIQSILFQEYLDILLDGISGKNCVLSGLTVTGGADMTPAVAKGAVLSNSIMYPVAAADVTIGAADATNPRIDLIVVTSAGALAVRAGTAAAAPKPPTRTANDVAIASVYVAANDTTIGAGCINDKRVVLGTPTCIYKTTTQEVTNTSAAAIHALNKAGSGVVIPSGLLSAGRLLKVKLGGNLLINSTTPTTTIAITFGGVTWFSDLTAAGANDADRRAWNIEFVIAAQASNVQHIVGQIGIEVQAATVTAPTTGIAGELSGTTGATASIISPFEGATGSVDADAADRTLAVTFTFSVSNAANELVTEYAIVELV